MFKKVTASALALVSLVSIFSVSAAATPERISTMDAVGIVDSSESLYAQVTRGDLAEMLVNASIYAESVGSGYGYSLYTDVKSSHDQSAYIKVCVENGWMSGYIDGSFRPEQAMKLEEVVSAVLKLIGYTNEDLVGAYPFAQLSKASALGILDNVSTSQGQYITTDDAINIFYNALLADTKDGKTYGETLGLTISGDSIDYGSLVTDGTKGPYVSYDGSISVPFALSGATVYIDGEVSSYSEIDSYDVYYYHSDMNTVWVYDDKVSGTISEIAPSDVAPTSVTVAGVPYQIGTSNATYQLSAQGTYGESDSVTLLLGMDGKVAEVVSSTQANNEYYGIAISSETVLSETGDSSAVSTKIACTDGIVRTFVHDGSSYNNNEPVNVLVTTSGTKISELSDNGFAGTVNSTATKLGSYEFADDVQILDVDEDGNYTNIYPSRIASVKLYDSDITYYAKNENGEISHLILDSVTGDTYTYGYVMSAESTDNDMKLSGSYEFMIDGQEVNLNTVDSSLNIGTGGAIFDMDEKGSVSSVKTLNSVKVDSISGYYAYADNTKYTISEEVQVVLLDGGQFISVELSSLNTENYNFTGYYDSVTSVASGQIRVLLATPK